VRSIHYVEYPLILTSTSMGTSITLQNSAEVVMAEIEMVIDSIRVSLMNYQRVAVLKEKEGERYLPIWIGPAEADAIAVKIQGVRVPRPLTHDFVGTVIDTLGATVESTVISDLKKDTFYAKVVLNKSGEKIEIDCRPSDALAVAIRVGAPIFANEKVVEKASILLDKETGKPILTGVTSPEIESDKHEIFSESARDILSLAEKEAQRHNHNFVGTGHILLVLAKNIPTVGSQVLSNLGINLAKIQVEIEASIEQQRNIESCESGLTSAVKKAIELSIKEAKRLGSGEVQPEHILLGLIRQNKGVAASLLKNLGINAEGIYIELIRLYNQSRGY